MHLAVRSSTEIAVLSSTEGLPAEWAARVIGAPHPSNYALVVEPMPTSEACDPLVNLYVL
jgi:hypothetical protein